MKSVCIRQIRVDNVKTSIKYACWYGRKHPDPSGKLLKYGQSKSNVGLLFTKLLENLEEPGNIQLADFRCDLKR